MRLPCYFPFSRNTAISILVGVSKTVHTYYFFATCDIAFLNRARAFSPMRLMPPPSVFADGSMKVFDAGAPEPLDRRRTTACHDGTGPPEHARPGAGARRYGTPFPGQRALTLAVAVADAAAAL